MRSLDGITVVTLEHATMASAAIYTLNPNRWQPWMAGWWIDPVHFGIMMVVNMEVGMCHPPVGLNLYVVSGITKMGISELTVAVMPWLLTMLAFLMLVTYVPQISLWLPNLLFGK